jgi:hypothetical protein
MKQFLPKLLVFLFSILILQAQVSKTARPDWVYKIQTPYEAKVNFSSISNGYYYIIYDDQYHLEKKTEYVHYAIKVLTDAGVQEASEISVDFQPSYQKLEFHSIEIIRGNKRIQVLPKIQIKQIQRETDLESKIYDGSKTAFIALNDIRKGDIIEYDFSLNGFNPIYGDKFFKRVSVGFSQPIPLVNFRVLAKKDRIFKSKTIGKKSISLKTRFVGDLKELYFQTACLEAIQGESNTPGSYYNYPEFTISEYKNWAEVVRWALPLYSIETIHPSIKQKLKELAVDCKNQEELVVKIIRFVQDEIRYLGFEVGVNSHQPSKPEDVLKRRFGDCKDKSFLLCTMLKQMNVDAIPVLIHTERKEGLKNELPSPLQFNHVTVKVNFGTQSYYIDPTISFQRGSLENIQYPEYRFGLLVESGNAFLNDLGGSYGESYAEYQENFDVMDSIQPIRLNVFSKYVGKEADYMRYYFASESKENIESGYLKFYENLYKNVKAIKPIHTIDDDTLNIFYIEESYEIAKQWAFNQEKKLKIFELTPQLIMSQASLPDSRSRSTPYQVNYYQAQLTITVKLPTEWEVSKEKEEIVNQNFQFRFNSENTDPQTVELVYVFNSFNSVVEPHQFTEYYENLEKLNNYSGYQFSWLNNPEIGISNDEKASTESETGFRWNLLMLVIAYITLGVLFFVFKSSYKRDIVPECEVEFAQPIGGWLLLLGFNLLISPFINLYYIIDGQYFNQVIWNTLNDSSSPGYNESLPGYFLLELLFRLAIISVNSFSILLFFKRRSTFPQIQIFSLILVVVFYLIELNLIFLIDSQDSASNEEIYKGLIKGIIGAVVWTWYLIKSERVRSTFVFTYDKSKEKHYVEGQLPE